MTAGAIYPSLKDRVVFVTGGGGGIGASIVEQFCRQGARVGFVDIDEEGSNELVEARAAAGHGKPLFVKCDLRDLAELDRKSVWRGKGVSGRVDRGGRGVS